jgi:hypothetical protein
MHNFLSEIGGQLVLRDYALVDRGRWPVANLQVAKEVEKLIPTDSFH